MMCSHVQMLALIFVYALDLNIEKRMRIHYYVCTLLKVIGQKLLIFSASLVANRLETPDLLQRLPGF